MQIFNFYQTTIVLPYTFFNYNVKAYIIILSIFCKTWCHKLIQKCQMMSKRPVWSESLLSAWRKLGSLATHWAHSEDSDQTYEPQHDKTNKVTVHTAKTQISLGIRQVWSESSLCAQWVAKDPSFLHADSEDSYQTGQMLRLIRVFAERTLIYWFCHIAAHMHYKIP